MPNRSAVIPYVTLCDPQGTLVWTNHPDPSYEPGEPVWDYVSADDREPLKDMIARAAFLNEPQALELSTRVGHRFRVWIWPLMVGSIRVCIVSLQLPDELVRLTDRERECLERLALGRSTQTIAAEFDVSVSTVHTYMKRAREKLGLASLEQLIAYSSRYCVPMGPPPVFGQPARRQPEPPAL